jgi:putative Mn2+ efflux pump MntP
MTFVAVIFTAFGLAMDAFAVSVASGLTIKKLRLRNAMTIAASFGMFQAVMPVIGWLAGLGIRDFTEHIDHWLAFGLLSFIGIKMIYESTKLETVESRKDPLRIPVLFVLSVATSMDALAVGLTFAFLNISIAAPVVIIGAVTFLLSLGGVYIGDRFGHFFEKKIEALAGVILILIGLKILILHLLERS